MKEDFEKTPQIYTDIDLELITFFSQINPTLVNIIKGVRRVVSDTENPDAFPQAANSIRGLTDILIRNAQNRMIENQSIALSEAHLKLIENMLGSFKGILSSIPEGIDGKEAYIHYLDVKFKELNKAIELALQGKPITTKQVLKSYFGRDKEIALLQNFAQKRIKDAILRWHECHIYFVQFTHYPDKEIVVSDFLSKWEEIQRCVLMALRPFFSSTSVLDGIMQQDQPPTESRNG